VNDLLTVPQAAKILNLGKSTTYALVESRELPAVRIGTAVRVRAETLDEFIRERETKRPNA
jgi:excisionase family DNA binding protein